MPDLDHPAWCVGAYCTAARPPFNGHQVGAHRSSPAVLGGLLLFVRQSPGGPETLELRRGDVTMVVPLAEARDAPVAIDELLETAGIAL